MKNRIVILVAFMSGILGAESEIHISVPDAKQGNLSVYSDDKGNVNYIYIDKNSSIKNSTIGTTIIINGEPKTKQEKIRYYNKKITRYQAKIRHYNEKINKYRDKIEAKPKNRDRYEAKIENYRAKIYNYQEKINQAKEVINNIESSKN